MAESLANKGEMMEKRATKRAPEGAMRGVRKNAFMCRNRVRNQCEQNACNIRLNQCHRL